jgi:hypothetical protein
MPEVETNILTCLLNKQIYILPGNQKQLIRY